MNWETIWRAVVLLGKLVVMGFAEGVGFGGGYGLYEKIGQLK